MLGRPAKSKYEDILTTMNGIFSSRSSIIATTLL